MCREKKKIENYMARKKKTKQPKQGKTTKTEGKTAKK